MKPNFISLPVLRIIRLLIIVAVILVLASVCFQLLRFSNILSVPDGLIRIFDLNQEANIPTFFEALILFCIAILLAVIALINIQKKESYRWKWLFFSLLFMYLAFDEAAQIHELFTGPVRRFINQDNLGIFYFAWVIPGILFLVAIVLFFLKFIQQLPIKLKKGIILGFTLYFSGAIGMELLNGQYAEIHGKENLIYNMMSTIEESLEMGGTLVIFWVILKYISNTIKEVFFRFE